MDKNISALLREDTKTVRVRFFNDRNQSESYSLELGAKWIGLSAKEYCYITNLDFKIDDLAVVLVADIPKIVIITGIDDCLDIEPNESTKYKWIYGTVDASSYVENEKKNESIERIVTEAYKKNLKNQFQEIILSSLTEKSKESLENLLKKADERMEGAKRWKKVVAYTSTEGGKWIDITIDTSTLNIRPEDHPILHLSDIIALIPRLGDTPVAAIKLEDGIIYDFITNTWRKG